ncbi:MAG: hypothetical protein ACJ8AD_15080, partial [Gemmatimonadaceae bacterium]
IRKSIDEQGKLTPELAARLDAVGTKQELEDLYLPYKPKRRTRATIAWSAATVVAVVSRQRTARHRQSSS